MLHSSESCFRRLSWVSAVLLFPLQLVRQFDNVRQQVADAQALISDTETRLLMTSSSEKPTSAPQRSPPGVGACGRWVVWLWWPLNSPSTTAVIRVPTPPEKSWIFFLENSGTWKVLENHFGPGKSWKLKLKVLEGPAKISLKVMHFSSGSNGNKQQWYSTEFVLTISYFNTVECWSIFLQWTTLWIL